MHLSNEIQNLKLKFFMVSFEAFNLLIHKVMMLYVKT
jgi:hypothetical protein